MPPEVDLLCTLWTTPSPRIPVPERLRPRTPALPKPPRAPEFTILSGVVPKTLTTVTKRNGTPASNNGTSLLRRLFSDQVNELKEVLRVPTEITEGRTPV